MPVAQTEQVVFLDHGRALLTAGLIGPTAVLRRTRLGRTGRDRRRLRVGEPGDHGPELPRSPLNLLPEDPGLGAAR